MTPFEIKSALNSMVVICDTREQNTPRLRARLKQTGCAVERKKLDFGDYSAKFSLPDDKCLDLSEKIVIERKMNLDEICSCYCFSRNRFTDEFERAKQASAKIYLLIENSTWEHAYNGRYRSKMTSESLIASLFAWLARYNCQIIMCKAETSGRLIRDILYREGKERLEKNEIC